MQTATRTDVNTLSSCIELRICLLGIAALVALALPSSGRAALVIHYDASQGSSVRNTTGIAASSGEHVGTWQDLAGGDQHGVPAVGNPIFHENAGPLGKPALAFPGKANIVSGSTQARTVIMVHRWIKTANGNLYLIDGRTGINAYVFGTAMSGWTAFVNDATSSASAGALWSDEWQITTLNGSSTGTDDLHFFSRYLNGSMAWGYLAEVRVFDNLLTEGERLTQVAELQSKWFAGSAPSYLPELITPTNVTSSTTDYQPAINLINNSGFDGPVELYYYQDLLHNSGLANNWYTDKGDSDPVLEFQLPQLIPLTDVVAWNYAYSPVHAATDFDIEFSTDGGATYGAGIYGTLSFTGAGTSSQAAFTMNLGGSYMANAVRITITDNAGGIYIGLGEIRFVGQEVPQPPTGTVFIIK